MKIFHISDIHGETRTQIMLDEFSKRYHCCKVLALTGDCTSETQQQVPDCWNDWPYKLRLSVPGNHDKSDTYSPLRRWEKETPWIREDFNGLTFIGIDTSEGCFGIQYKIDKLDRVKTRKGSALVILSHRWPSEIEGVYIGQALAKISNNRPVLFLHGHEHPLRLLWETNAKIGTFECYRSHVYSSRNHNGLGHIIKWDNHKFYCSKVRIDQNGRPIW